MDLKHNTAGSTAVAVSREFNRTAPAVLTERGHPGSLRPEGKALWTEYSFSQTLVS
jgi:hypothetical protein